MINYMVGLYGGPAMCDTLGCVDTRIPIFGKNSDRCVDEPQLLEFHPKKNNSEKTLMATYIEIDQVQRTNAILISRPSWMYGAEMGLNEYGLVIGNEAVFTKGGYNKTGLTGMDLLRLALERTSNAKQALELIITYLEKYGQGGNCAYEGTKYYNNSFLIMDRDELYVLETYDKQWAYRKSKKDSISNRLSISSNSDDSSQKKCDFARIHTEPVYTYLCGSGYRRGRTQLCINNECDFEGFKKALRSHNKVKDPFSCGTANSVCMHGGGVVDNQTTASLIVQLYPVPVIWATCSSLPCISLYKPYLFGAKSPFVYTYRDENQGNDNTTSIKYWKEREAFNRRMLGNPPPDEYYEQMEALENEWRSLVMSSYDDSSEMEKISLLAYDQEKQFFEKMDKLIAKQSNHTLCHLGFWKNRNL
jgi:dipeptidase